MSRNYGQGQYDSVFIGLEPIEYLRQVLQASIGSHSGTTFE